MHSHGVRTTRFARPVMLAAVACLMAAASAGAATRFGDISIAVQTTPTGASTHGYAEFRFLVSNTSRSDQHVVTITYPERSNGYGHHIREMTRSVAVAPGSTAMLTLLQPPVSIQGSGATVRIDGRIQRETLHISGSEHGTMYGYYSYPGGGSSMCILLSRNVDANIQAKVEEIVPKSPSAHGYGGGQSPCQFVRPEISVSGWSSNWLAYSRYDGVVVNSGDMLAMAPEARAALWQYVECGGSLLIIGPYASPAATQPSGNLSVVPTGFGECIINPETRLARWSKTDWKRILKSWRITASPFQNPMSPQDANQRFPVIENIQVPVRGMFLLILIFAIAIGPANLIILSRKRKRIWMLWTIPAISLLTCLAVFVYSVFAEGWSGHARTSLVTLLDETTSRATTLGMTAFYSPLTPGGGLRFDHQTELTPQVAHTGYREGTARTIDWTADQHLASGWVTARVPAHFRVRHSQGRRERLTVRRQDDGTVSVMNGLGSHITTLRLADQSGLIYSADNIAPGMETPLHAIDPARRTSAAPDVLRDLYTSSWTTDPSAFVGNAHRFLRPGTYIAVLDTAPFIELGMQRVKSWRCKTTIYGIMKNPYNPADDD